MLKLILMHYMDIIRQILFAYNNNDNNSFDLKFSLCTLYATLFYLLIYSNVSYLYNHHCPIVPYSSLFA